jgi:CHAT domain-containing protein
MKNTWAADANRAKGSFAEAKGRFQEAEAYFKRAEFFSEKNEQDAPHYEDRPAVIEFQFSEEQAAEADRQLAQASTDTRGSGLGRRAVPNLRDVNSADLALLPRLPDTADELRAIALALHADPTTSLKLGREANERTVMSADLSRYRVVAFSTHGLVGGELNGLTQPALALTAPKVAGIEGDGMLTMEKILSLKLDADWTVLSACNTGAGIGAEAEAASGLGRAFFYAGSRALLVTNWPVITDAAKDLVSDLFQRQTRDHSAGKAEALRQAVIQMIDHGERSEKGVPVYSYAHPLFWAPYSIMGDGG